MIFLRGEVTTREESFLDRGTETIEFRPEVKDQGEVVREKEFEFGRRGFRSAGTSRS